MQILVELEDEYMGEVHPLLDTILGKEVPIAVVGRGKALKFFIDQLRGLDSCDGWQWLSTTTYDKTTGTPTMRMVERMLHFGIPHKLGIKIPIFFYMIKASTRRPCHSLLLVGLEGSDGCA